MAISSFLNSVVKEKFFDSVFGEQRAAEDAHDFHNRAIEFEVVFNDSDEANVEQVAPLRSLTFHE